MARRRFFTSGLAFGLLLLSASPGIAGVVGVTADDGRFSLEFHTQPSDQVQNSGAKDKFSFHGHVYVADDGKVRLIATYLIYDQASNPKHEINQAVDSFVKAAKAEIVARKSLDFNLGGGGKAPALEFSAKNDGATMRGVFVLVDGSRIYGAVGVIRDGIDGAATVERFLRSMKISATAKK